MTINLERETDRVLPVDERAIITCLAEETMRFVGGPCDSSVDVLLTGNDRIREINRDTRNLDQPTDVLSFPMLEFDTPGQFRPVDEMEDFCFDLDSGELLLGSIVISLDRVQSQAEEYGHSIERELAFLTAHSMLHLCGYDHMEEKERAVMEQMQEAILQKAGYVR